MQGPLRESLAGEEECIPGHLASSGGGSPGCTLLWGLVEGLMYVHLDTKLTTTTSEYLVPIQALHRVGVGRSFLDSNDLEAKHIREDRDPGMQQYLATVHTSTFR